MPEPFFKSPWEETGQNQPGRSVLSGPSKSRAPSNFPIVPVIIGVIAILVIGGGLFLAMRLVNQAPETAMLTLSTPKEVLLGQPFSLNVNILNSNAGVLKDAKLSIFLPPELNFADQEADQCKDPHTCEFMTGTIDKTGVVNRDVKIIAASGTLTVSHIQGRLLYTPPGTSAQFEKLATADVLIGAPAVTLDFTTPDKVLSGGSFETKITINNQSSEDMRDLSLELAFPLGYTMTGSDASSTAISTWPIPLLKRGEEKTLVITGYLLGQESDFSSITASLKRQEGGAEYVVSEKIATLNITAPSLALTIRPTGGDAPVHLNDQLQYSVSVANNSEVPLEGINLKVILVGELFNFSAIQTDGIVNPVNNTITWNSVSVPGLLRLVPGETQIVSFSVPVKDHFPISRPSDKNYVLKVNGTAESPTVLPGIASGKTVTMVKTETKVAGDIDLQTKAYYREPQGMIKNSGAYPPRANQPTQYTVHWILRNYATDMSRIEVSSFLDPYSHLVGQPTSNINTVPIYNSASGQIVWKIDKLAATQGVLGDPVEAVFQIEATPPSAYVGHDIILTRATALKAMDEFTGGSFMVTNPAIPSSLPDDQSLGNVDRTVQP